MKVQPIFLHISKTLPLQVRINILQWNSQGIIANKKAELMDLLSKEKPDVLYIQETMLSIQTNFNLKYYSGLLKERHTNYRAHGGVRIFIQ